MSRPCDNCDGRGWIPVAGQSPEDGAIDCPRCADMPRLANGKGQFVWADPEKSWGTIVAKPDPDTVEWRCVRGDESYLGPCLGHPDGRPRLGSSLELHPYTHRHDLCGWFPIVERLEVVTQ